MSDTQDDAPRRGRIGALTNAILSGSATIIAIVALGTGIYQAKLSRDQADASVWPFLLQGNSGNNGYSRLIQNVGIGPARIRAFEVRVNGHAVRNWREVAESLHIALNWRGYKSTTIRAGVVLPANTTSDILELPDSADARAFRAAITAAPSSTLAVPVFDTWICYCSIYGKCWEGTGHGGEPSETKSCRNDTTRAFRD